jgi:hypothetical protein
MPVSPSAVSRSCVGCASIVAFFARVLIEARRGCGPADDRAIVAGRGARGALGPDGDISAYSARVLDCRWNPRRRLFRAR